MPQKKNGRLADVYIKASRTSPASDNSNGKERCTETATTIDTPLANALKVSASAVLSRGKRAGKR